MATAFRADPSRLSPIDDAAPAPKAAFKPDPSRLEPEGPTRLDLSKVNYERQGYYYPDPDQQGAFDPSTADLTTPPVGRPGVIPTDPNDAARIAGTPQTAGIEDIAAAVPFLGGAKQALDSAALKEAVLRVKAGTHTPSDLQTLKRFQMDSARGTTLGKDIAAGVAGSARLGGQAAIGSIAGPVGSAAGMLLDPGAIVSRYNAQTTPEIKIDSAGGMTIGEPPSKTKEEALKKVAALQTSDAVIEMFGGKAVSGAMGIGGKALGKVAGKYLPETSAAVKAVAKRYGDNTAANLLQRGQIQGIIPEYMEEVMQSVANYNIGEPGQDPKALLDPTNPEALKTALVIGILNSPRLVGMLQKRKDDTPTPPPSDAPANAAPTGDMNLTLTPEQPVTQSDVADIFSMFDEPAAQPAAGAPTAPVARQTPDTLPPLPPGATIPVQGTSAPPARQPDSMKATLGDPFAGKEFEGKKGTAVTFKTSEPIEITDKYGSYKVSYQITDDGDGFRLQRIDEDGTKSHLGDDGFWYKTYQPMPNRRDNIVMPEKYRTEAQAHQAALEDASGMGWKGPSTATKSATQGTAAPPRVAPIAPGSAVMRPVPTLTPEEVQAWSEEADALAPGEQEIVADYLMQNPGNPEQLSPREIVARGKRDVWRMTPEEQAKYEQVMGLNEQESEASNNKGGSKQNALRGLFPSESLPSEVYHGTPADFSRMEVMDQNPGLFSFTDNINVARNYASGVGGSRVGNGNYALIKDDDGIIYDFDESENKFIPIYQHDYDKNKYLPPPKYAEPLSLSEAEKGVQGWDFSTLNRKHRVLRADIRGRKILDLTSPEGLSVLSGLDTKGNRGAASVIEDASDNRYPAFHWSSTKYAGPEKHMERVIIPQLRKMGYEGIHYNDDGHKTFALFDAPEKIDQIESFDIDKMKQPQETSNEEVQGQGRKEEVAPPTPLPRGRKAKQAPVTPVEAAKQAPPVASSTGPTPASPEGAGVSKQPWEMTREEWLNDAPARRADAESGGVKGEPKQRIVGKGNKSRVVNYNAPPDNVQIYDHAIAAHKSNVEAALRDGLPVPASVLADYPDLSPPTPPAPISPAPAPAKRPAPPRKGSTSPTGWSTVAKGVARKDIEGSTVEIVRQADGSWSVTRDEKEMGAGYKSRTEAEKYADDTVVQDIRDQRNADEEASLASDPIPVQQGKARKSPAQMSDAELDSAISVARSQQSMNELVAAMTEKKRRGSRSGPAPADTGIYRDLTAAAREGKRFVAELHERIAPALERIYAQSKNAVDFVKQAVAKIGKHIRPYAKRFAMEVKRGVRETRGAALNPGSFLQGRRKRDQPKDQQASNATFSAGVQRGRPYGGLRDRKEIVDFAKKIKEVVPDNLRSARDKAMKRVLADKSLTDKARQRKMDGLIRAARADVMKYEGVAGVERALSKVKKSLPNMEGSLRKVAVDIINSFNVATPTNKTLEAAEEMLSGLVDGTIKDGAVSPRAVEKAQRTIENFVAGRNLKSMPLAEVRQLRDLLERIESWHKGGLEAIKERLANDRKDIDQTADDVMADAKQEYPPGDFKDSMSFLQAKENVPMSLRNLIGLLGPKGSRIVKRFVEAFDEGERKTARVRHDAHRHILKGLAEVGLLKDKGQGVYESTDDLLSMSPFITGVASRGATGRAVGKVLGQAQPQYKEFGGVKYTTGERIKLYNLARDPEAKHALVKGKGSDTVFARNDEFARMDGETLDAIVDSLSAKERKVADLMFEYNNGPLRDQMNEAWNAMYGHDIFTETNHESMRRRLIGEEPDARAKKLGNSYTENMGIFKPRKGGNEPIIIDDAFAEFFSHVNKVAMAVGQMQVSMDARRALATPALKTAIKRSHPRGNALLRELNNRIEEYGSISAKGVDEVEAGARIFLNNMTGTMVATSPTALITTPMSIPSAQSVIPLGHLLANTRPSTGKTEFAEIEKESPILYAIITDTGHRVTTPEAAGIGVQRFFGNQKNTVSERVTTVLRKLNDQAVYAIWRAAKQWGESQGLKGAELMDFTARKAEEAYSRSQPDNAFTNQSGAKLRARKSLWYALGTSFQGQTQKAWNQALEARNDYRWSKGTTEDKEKYARDVFFPVILQTLLYRGIATAVAYGLASAKDDERKLKEAEKDFWKDLGMEGVLDVVSQVPMLGGMLSDPMRMVYNGLTGKPKWTGTSSILARTGEEVEKAAYGAGRGLRKLFTGKGKFDAKSIAEPILFVGQGIGVPAKLIKDLMEITGVTD